MCPAGIRVVSRRGGRRRGRQGGGEQQQHAPSMPHIGRHVTVANANSTVVNAGSTS